MWTRTLTQNALKFERSRPGTKIDCCPVTLPKRYRANYLSSARVDGVMGALTGSWSIATGSRAVKNEN